MSDHQFSDSCVCIRCGVSKNTAEHFKWSCRTDEDNVQANSSIILHLVHGTWPEGGWFSHRFKKKSHQPFWFEPGSTTWTQLAGDDNVIVSQAPSWSGNNSFKDRSEGGEILRNYLENNFKSHKKSKHVIIAHSHGGNVALLALNGMSEFLREQFVLITVGTPFFHIGLREIISPEVARSGLRQWPWIILSLTILKTFGFPTQTFFDYLLLTLCALVFVVIIDLIHQYIATKKINPYLEELSNVKTPPNTLVLRTAGDEASSSVGMAEIMSRHFLKLISFEPLNIPNEIQRSKNPSINASSKVKLSRIQYITTFTPIIIMTLGIIFSSSDVIILGIILNFLVFFMPYIASIPLAIAYDPWLFGWIPTKWFQVDALPIGKEVVAKAFVRSNLSGSRHSINLAQDWVEYIQKNNYGMKIK